MERHLTFAPGELPDYFAVIQPELERALGYYLPTGPEPDYKVFNEALGVALLEGKRFRPMLTVLGAEVVGGRFSTVLPAAVGIEYVHTSSLIFDDLPCMDNATQRRGHLALHLRYGEAVAVLVALTLLNTSYGLLLKAEASQSLTRNAHSELVKAIGPIGLIGGQFFDLTVESQTRKTKTIDSARILKTSALIGLSLRVGALLSGATLQQLAALSSFADLVGMAYQISDDITDRQEDSYRAKSPRANEFTIREGKTQSTVGLVSDAQSIILDMFGSTRAALLLCEVASYSADLGGRLAGRSNDHPDREN